MKCQQCGRNTASFQTPSGRSLCEGCYRQLATYGGAGSALVSGAGIPEAVGTGIAVGGFAGAVEADLQRQIELNRRLAETKGFWRRLWLRVVG
jgi:ribosomal protein S27E